MDECDDGSVDDNRPTGGLWDKEKNYDENIKQCFIYQTGKKRDESASMCYEACRETIEAAQAEGRTTNYGCTGFWPLDEPIPWTTYPGKT